MRHRIGGLIISMLLALGMFQAPAQAASPAITGSVAQIVASSVQAQALRAGQPPFGTKMLAGKDWLGGKGVDVYSNGSTTNVSKDYGPPAVGMKWQCVELAQRLYKTRGWYPGLFKDVGVAKDIYPQAPNLGMTRQAQGHVTSVQAGDMIIWGTGLGAAGHVAIANGPAKSGQTFTIVEQNSSVGPTGKVTLSGGTLTRSGFPGILGVVHDPDNKATAPVATNVGYNNKLKGETLKPGQRLNPGEYIMSADGRGVLQMQRNGDLAVFGPGFKLLWHSGTAGKSGAYAVLQGDGNFVVYYNGKAIWNTGKKGIAVIKVQTDINTVGRNSAGKAVWATNTVKGTVPFKYIGTSSLRTGAKLRSGEALRSSDGRYFWQMQSDGNWVLYGPGYHVLWNAKTGGHPGAYVAEQGDRNTVIYDSSGHALWATGVGQGGVTIGAQTDGNGVARDADNTPRFRTNTAGKI